MNDSSPAQTISRIFTQTRRIAVLGIKTAAQASQPAYYVPQYLLAAGFELVPVPVYYPEVREILGQPVYRRVQDIPGRVDLVNVFRRSADLAAHLDDLLTARPAAVWLQLGIHDAAFSSALRAAGIAVVEDRCLMIEHQHWRERA